MSNDKRWRVGLRDSGDRIWIDFPYNDQVIALLKERVSGLRWDADCKLWHAPLDMDTAKDIRSVAKHFGQKLLLEAEFFEWATKEKARYANLLKPDDMSADTSGWLPRLREERPSLIEAMSSKPWQIPGTAFMVGQESVLLADQPGLGKTIQTLAAIAERDVRGPILVVAPRTAVNVTWPEEIVQWLGEDEVIFKISGSIKPSEREATLRAIREHSQRRPHDLLCGPNYLRVRAKLDDYGNYKRDDKGHKIVKTINEGLEDLFQIRWAAVIVDESHQTLAGASGNKKKQSAQRQGLGALTLKENGLRIAISGTPFRGKTENLWGTLNWLFPEKYTSYWNWVKRHYGIKATGSRYGSGIGKGDVIIDEKKFFSELKPIMVRRTKSEVAPSLPPKVYAGTHLDPNDQKSPVAVWLPMTGKQQSQYDEIVQQAMMTINAMGETIDVNGVLAEMTRMKQVANSAVLQGPGVSGLKPALPSNKIEWIENFLEDRIDAGTKVIVASQFTGFINTLSDYLDMRKIGHYVLTGQTSDAERLRIKTEFQKEGEGEMVILLNTKAGGVSLTLDRADDVVVCDETWIPDETEQLEDRAHRVSRDHNVTIWKLCSLRTIDEQVALVNTRREADAKSVLDKQRGVSYVKTLLNAVISQQRKAS